MAIELEQKYKGITANYWRIDNFSYDDMKDVARVDLWLYADEESAKDGNGLIREVLTVSGIKDMAVPEVPEGTSPRDLVKAMLYEKITESNEDAEGNELNKFATGIQV